MNVKYGYSVVKKTIGQRDLSNSVFEQLENRRRIRQGAVRDIYLSLSKGKHFNTPLFVNHKEGKYFLIDGNHRWEAIKRFLEDNKNNKVEVTLFVYKNLTDDEEKELYSIVNRGNKQTTNDVVKQFENDILLFKLLKNGWLIYNSAKPAGQVAKIPVPVTAYPSPNSISFFRLVGSYLAAQQDTFQGGWIGTPWDFISEAQRLGHKDARLLSAFLFDFLEAFGPIKNNHWTRTTPFVALMKIWIDNYKTMRSETMTKWWKTRLANDSAMIDLGRNSGAGAAVTAYQLFLTKLNYGRRRNLFV